MLFVRSTVERERANLRKCTALGGNKTLGCHGNCATGSLRVEQLAYARIPAHAHTHTLTRGICSVSRETSPTQQRDEAPTRAPNSFLAKKMAQKKKKNYGGAVPSQVRSDNADVAFWRCRKHQRNKPNRCIRAPPLPLPLNTSAFLAACLFFSLCCRWACE